MEKIPFRQIHGSVADAFLSLCVGQFLIAYAKNEKIDNSGLGAIEIRFENSNKYVISEDLISQGLNLVRGETFNKFIEWNAFRSIAMAMNEGVKEKEGNQGFIDFLNDFFKHQYSHFYAILAFSRNSLSHNIRPTVAVFKDDFDRVKEKFWKQAGQYRAEVIVNNQTNPNLSLSPGFSYHFFIDFDSITDGTPFLNVFPKRSLYLFSELCFNLCNFYSQIL
jgi:hypothetical protein